MSFGEIYSPETLIFLALIVNFHYVFLKILQHFPHYYTHEGGRAYGGPPRGRELSAGNLLS